jgi:hypothetical protein
MNKTLAHALLSATLLFACGDDDGSPGPDARPTDARPCTSSCDVEGQAICDVSGNGRFDCVRADSGCLQKQYVACGSGDHCYEGLCRP